MAPNEVAVAELRTVRDFIRWGASRFNEAGLFFGHGTDNAWDEATTLVLHALHLPPDVHAEAGGAVLTTPERQEVVTLLKRRLHERKPAAYLTHEAWFAGLPFFVDERVLVPRSPIGELIQEGFSPWLDGRPVRRVLDVGTGSGCIAIACALVFAESQVDAVDVSEDALEVARTNALRHFVEDRVHLLRSDLFSAVQGRRYDLIVSNPPYVSREEMQSLPDEFLHEPELGLSGGEMGLDLVTRLLAEADEHLQDEGFLVVEVGSTQAALAERFPEVPFTWLELSRGGHGVLVLPAEEVRRFHPAFEAATE
jgi:ribosomal protein L3 glutamine methyltransferase